MSGLSRMRYGKRILAMMLSAALVMGSGDFTLFVNAENAADNGSGSTSQTDGDDVAAEASDDEETIGTNDGNETEFCKIEDGKLTVKWDDIKAAAADDKTVTVDIPEKVTEISTGTFNDPQLTGFKIDIKIPKGSKLTTIGAGAFQGSAIISSLTISGDVHLEKIGDNAFAESSITKFAFLSDDEKSEAEEDSKRMMRAAGDTETSNTEASDTEASNANKPLTWGEYVFQDCEGLTTVTLPEDMTEITAGMFKGCGKLKTIKIPERCEKVGASAFEGCKVLEEIDFPQSVKEIGDRALVDCKALQKVTIRQRGKEADEDGNPDISDIKLPEDLFGWTEEQTSSDENASNPDTAVSDDSADGPSMGESGEGGSGDSSGDETEEGTLQAPAPSEPIELWGYNGSVEAYVKAEGKGREEYLEFNSLFDDNTYFTVDAEGYLRLKTNITLSEGQTKITDAELPDSAKIIPVGIFDEPGESQQPDESKEMAESEEPSELEGPEEPEGPEAPEDSKQKFTFTALEIGANSQLEKIEWDETNKTGAFENSSITLLSLPEGVKEIPSYTFRGSKLTSIGAEKVETIGDSAFENCTVLSGKLTLPSVKTIGDSAFKNCTALSENFTLPNVETIGGSAFENCTALNGTITLSQVKTIGALAFRKCATAEGAELVFAIGSSLETIEQGAFQESGVVAVFGLDESQLAEVPDDAFSGCVNLSEVTLPESCTTIGNSAFAGCKNLQKINIPKKCVGIGNSAFMGCENFSGTLNIPESCTIIGSSAFQGCKGLEQVNILAKDLTGIGEQAFYGCIKLATVEIYQHSDPDSEDGVSTIELWYRKDGDILWDVFDHDQGKLTLRGYDGTVELYALEKGYTFKTLFEENDWFRVNAKGVLVVKDPDWFYDKVTGTVKLPKSAKIIPQGIFDNHVGITGLTVPADSQLETIESNAFEGSGITTLTIPKGVKEIGKRTFRYAKLQTLTFAEGSLLEEIGEEAFSESALKELKLPYTLDKQSHNDEPGEPAGDVSEDTESGSGEEENLITVTIGPGAFYRCSALEKISLRNVAKIDSRAFYQCTSLSIIEWGNCLESVGDSAFAGCAVTSLDLTILDKAGAESVRWGNGVFEGCVALRTVTLPNSMKRIPGNMFRDCSALSTLKLPDDCTDILQQAFAGCSSLATVVIPSKVNNIGTKAFADCKSLIMVTIYQQAATGGESDISIAEDAFPVKKLTMRGYDGTVETYASMKGYTFRTLFTVHTVSVDVQTKGGTAVLSKETARSGESLEVTVTANEGYRLKASTFTCNGVKITHLKSSNNRSQTFTFLMPDADAIVTVEFEQEKAYEELSVTFEQIGSMPYHWNEKEKILELEEAGLAVRLIVQSKGADLGCWELSYSVGSNKVARVDSDGILYAMGKGSAKVTATLKTDTSRKVEFTVLVSNDLEIGEIELDIKHKWNPEKFEGQGSGDGEDIEYPVVEYTKSTLQQAEQNFAVELKVKSLKASGQDSYFVKSEWKSSNTQMVTVDTKTCYDNKNVIRVKKGVTGEACVTVTVGQETKSIIVRVIDSTPRLVQNTLTLNSRSQAPKAAFELLPMYGYQVDRSSLRVVQAVKKDGITNYEQWEYAVVSEETQSDNPDKYYLALTPEGKTAVAAQSKDRTYTDIYLQGKCAKDNEEQIFYVSLKKVVLTNKALKPRVTLSGRINLFYKAQAGVDKCGSVTIKQSLKDLEVKDYRLLSAENYKAGRYKNPGDPFESGNDALANNFQVDVEKNLIKRSDNELIKVKNKAVTSGYLGILYDGYDEFCWVKITIPTKTTKPSYVLSKTKVTVSAGSTGYPIYLKLLDKKTKEEVILTEADADVPAEITLNHSSSKTTPGLFYDFGDSVESGSCYIQEDNIIQLKLDTVQQGKATIDVQLPDWNAPVAYTFKVNVAKGQPKVRPKSSTLTLNLLSGAETFTPLTLTPDDVTLIGVETELLTGARNAEDAVDPGIDLGYDEETGTLNVSGGDSEAKGRYRFRVRPKVRYYNGVEGDATPFTVTVNVVEKEMSVKLKSSTVTLNRLYAGLDKREVGYTVQNMPAGDSLGEITMEGVNDASRAVVNDLKFQSNGNKIQVSLKSPSVSAGTYKFRAVEPQTESGASLRPFTITVKVVERVAKVNVKASGSINMLNENSCIKYTLTASNVNVVLDDENLIVRELDGRNQPYTDEDTGEYVLKHFDCEIIEEKGKKLVKISAKTAEEEDGEEGTAITSGTYKLQFGLIVNSESDAENGSASDPGTNPVIQESGQESVSAGSQVIWSKDVNVKPKQTLPKIKTDVTETTLYAGVDVTSARRSQEITLEKTSVQEAVISGVGLAKGNSEYVNQAFKIGEFDSDTQSVNITLLRPDLLKPNTTYVLKLEARMKGQISGSAGAPFTVKIRVAN